MADGTETVIDSKQEIANQMAIALGTQQPIQQPVEQPINEQIQPDNNAEPAVPPAVTEPTAFNFEVFKEKFGYEKPEDVLSEIEQLRLLKENPPAPQPIKYENEESQKLHLALMNGKKEEVYAILEKQQTLEKLTSQQVTKENAADIIKMGMQLKFKDLSPEEIAYKFNKEYTLPKQPVFNENLETEEEFQSKLDNWKEQVADIEMNKIINAKLMKPELDSAKSNLTLPEIEKQIDEGYDQYLKMLEETTKLDADLKEAYRNLKPQDVLTKVPFTDEASKVNFEFQFTPDDDSFKKAVEIASDNEKFFNTFLNSDGSPNRQLWVNAVLFAIDPNKIIAEAIKQGSNARMKSMLPDNSQGGMVRQMPQEQNVNELDAAMKYALGIK